MTNNLQRTALVTLATSAAIFGLVGCAGSGDSEPEVSGVGAETGSAQTPAPDSSGNATDSTGDATSGASTDDATEYANAIAAAEELIGNGAFAIDLEREDDDSDDDEAFNIDVVEGTTVHEIDILQNGTARLDETETREVDADDQREIDAAELTLLEAIEAALRHQAGTVDEVELDTENGTVVWSVDFEDDALDDLHVNAITGEVTVND